MIYETKRLILRPWEEADAEECHKYEKDPQYEPIVYHGYDPGSIFWNEGSIYTSVENSRQIIREVLSVPDSFAIVWKETALPIGGIGLKFADTPYWVNQDDDACELVYWLGVPYWGQGIMPEAVQEILRYVFENLGMKNVWWEYYDINEQSERTKKKLGFHYKWTTENIEVPLVHELRAQGYMGHISTKQWVRSEPGGSESEWRWCLVGNIVKTHEFGENHEIKYGSKHFSAGTKVYMAPVQWGDGYEQIYVIGKPRHGHNYITIIMRREYIENIRLRKVYNPAVLERMNKSVSRWWGNTDAARDDIIPYLERLNPEEAEKEKRKLETSKESD